MNSIVVRSVMLSAEIFQHLEIEIHLVPGLPTIQFLGLPGASLKESALRIRTALRAAGFKMPRGRQILVDIRPRDEKKHGRGVDLAVAIGYLILTGQVSGDSFRDCCFYGDLALNGEVTAPSDWERVRMLTTGALLTGTGPIDQKFRGGRRAEGIRVVRDLRCLNEIETVSARRDESARPDLNFQNETEISWLFEPRQAELALLAAVGGHSVLLAGPPGTGKSTLARMIHHLRPNPTIEESCEIETWAGERERPLIEPHHTASELAMVGGRQPPRPGAITRAHRGTLLLDEVLLFRPEVQEALREPLETGVVHLARGPESRKFPADFQLLGTTNLCDCGMWTPGAEDLCKCPSRVRSKFDTRLKGPFVDRFQILAFTNEWKPSKGAITSRDLRKQIAEVRTFQSDEGRPDGNRRWRPEAGDPIFSELPTDGSERRRLAIQRVARTFADIELRRAINRMDLFRAREWGLNTFTLLQK